MRKGNMNHRRHIRAARRGFTLIELLIVIAILLGLAGIVAGTFLVVGEQADVDLQRVQMNMIDDAMTRFKMDMKRYPTEEEGLAALWDQTLLETEEDEESWRGPYIEDPIVEDKWGNEFEYYFPSQLRPESDDYDLVSFGPDGEPDTEDDITNHNASGGAGSEDEMDMDFSVPGGSGTGG